MVAARDQKDGSTNTAGASLGTDSAEEIARDVEVVGRLEAVPKLLTLLCDVTGMRFAAVARVTDGTWTACAVVDRIRFGLIPGGQLDLKTTLCFESRAGNCAITIDQASLDPQYRDHHTPRIYNIESYVSVPIVLPSGRYFGNLCAIDPAPAQVSDPRTLAVFKGLADVIALQLENELAREKDQIALRDAQAAALLREQFVAVLGHDLRNPLQAVYMTSHVLERRLKDSPLNELAIRITANAKRMGRLIDDVLDFTRTRLGSGIAVDMQVAPDISERLLSVIEELRQAHPQRVILCDMSLHEPVYCDVHRLQQVLSNLLGNALTHGAADHPIRIVVALANDELIMQVTNQGNPIPEASLDRVFEPFWRNTTSADRQGLGLGLHICSQIVRSHRGQILVTSSRDGGTCFTVRIPQPQLRAVTVPRHDPPG